jgi:hypothetical protein
MKMAYRHRFTMTIENPSFGAYHGAEKTGEEDDRKDEQRPPKKVLPARKSWIPLKGSCSGAVSLK